MAKRGVRGCSEMVVDQSGAGKLTYIGFFNYLFICSYIPIYQSILSPYLMECEINILYIHSNKFCTRLKYELMRFSQTLTYITKHTYTRTYILSYIPSSESMKFKRSNQFGASSIWTNLWNCVGIEIFSNKK